MKLELGLHQRLEQRLMLAPQIIQSIEILQLPLLELDRLIQEELKENPLLEIRETPQERTKKEREEDERKQGEYDKLADLENEWPDHFGQGRIDRASGEGDRKMEAMLNTAARPDSLQEFLFSQFNLLSLSPGEREVGEKIIFNIDRNGHLRYPLEEIFDFDGPGPGRAAVENVLYLVQGLEPSGVGGRDIVEVLLLQLDPGDPRLLVKERLIRDHLVDLMKNRLPKIGKALGLSMKDLKDLVAEIRLLEPRPGTLHSDEAPLYIVPEVIVEIVDGQYIVRLERGYVPSLRISGLYRKLLRDRSGDPETKKYVRKKIEAARWLIEAIEQRRNTLHRVASEIFKVQHPFLDHGVPHLTPLRMQDVADVLEIHVSTVSRAISDKHAQTHRGIYPLKFFFTGSTMNTDGKDLSRAAVKMRVQEIVDGENRSEPLSDEGIATALREEGLRVARRTVTKYRKMLNIPSSRRRKEF